MYRSCSDTGFYDKCSAVRALRVYLRPRSSLHRTENDNITLRPGSRPDPYNFGQYDRKDFFFRNNSILILFGMNNTLSFKFDIHY